MALRKGKKGAEKEKLAAAEVETVAPAVDDVEAAKVQQPVDGEPGEAEEAEPIEAPTLEMAMPAELPKYRVKKPWRGSLRGNMTYFAEGRIINPRGYGGLPGIEGLKKAGVELEEVGE